MIQFFNKIHKRYPRKIRHTFKTFIWYFKFIPWFIVSNNTNVIKALGKAEWKVDELRIEIHWRIEKWSIASSRIAYLENRICSILARIREGVQIQWEVGRFSCFSRANYYILLRSGWTGSVRFREIRALLWRCWFRFLLHSNITSLPEEVNISVWIRSRYLWDIFWMLSGKE